MLLPIKDQYLGLATLITNECSKYFIYIICFLIRKLWNLVHKLPFKWLKWKKGKHNGYISMAK